MFFNRRKARAEQQRLGEARENERRAALDRLAQLEAQDAARGVARREAFERLAQMAAQDAARANRRHGDAEAGGEMWQMRPGDPQADAR